MVGGLEKAKRKRRSWHRGRQADSDGGCMARAEGFCCIDQSKRDRVKTHTEETRRSHSCLARTSTQRLAHEGPEVTEVASSAFYSDQFKEGGEKKKMLGKCESSARFRARSFHVRSVASRQAMGKGGRASWLTTSVFG